MRTRPSRRTRSRLAGLAVAVAMATLAMTSAPAGAQTAPWTTFGGGAATINGASPTIAMVGDSLVALAQGVPPNGPIGTMANAIKSHTGRTTTVSAVNGASWVTYMWPGQQDPAVNNPYVWDLADFLNARLTIGALATNDARIMTQHPGSYSPTAQYDVMEYAVTQTRQHSSCVMLVNVEPRQVVKYGQTVISVAMAQAVNANMATLAQNVSRVFVADWAALAQEGWFNGPNDEHLNATGQQKYRNFIMDQARKLIQNHNC